MRDDATRDKYTGDMNNSGCRTGDVAVMDECGAVVNALCGARARLCGRRRLGGTEFAP
jgi:hypothetical protein